MTSKLLDAIQRGEVVLMGRAEKVASWFRPPEPEGNFPNRVDWRARWCDGTGNMPGPECTYKRVK